MNGTSEFTDEQQFAISKAALSVLKLTKSYSANECHVYEFVDKVEYIIKQVVNEVKNTK